MLDFKKDFHLHYAIQNTLILTTNIHCNNQILSLIIIAIYKLQIHIHIMKGLGLLLNNFT